MHNTTPAIISIVPIINFNPMGSPSMKYASSAIAIYIKDEILKAVLTLLVLNIFTHNRKETIVRINPEIK